MDTSVVLPTDVIGSVLEDYFSDLLEFHFIMQSLLRNIKSIYFIIYISICECIFKLPAFVESQYT